jgi:hypothetical protein
MTAAATDPMNPTTKAKCPPVPLALVEHLAEVFPDRCPSMGTTPDRLWAEAGAVRVVRYLRDQYERQQEDQLLGGKVLDTTAPEAVRMSFIDG